MLSSRHEAAQLGNSGAESNNTCALPIGLSIVLHDSKACQVTKEASVQQVLNNRHQSAQKGAAAQSASRSLGLVFAWGEN